VFDRLDSKDAFRSTNLTFFSFFFESAGMAYTRFVESTLGCSVIERALIENGFKADVKYEMIGRCVMFCCIKEILATATRLI
jgi:hypothetical protein